MKRFLLFSILLFTTASLAQAQRIPVTTASDEARVQYTKGLHHAMYLNFNRARVHLDAALDADPDFALAHLYRGWLSPSEKRAEHLRQANAHAATDAERQMIEGYEAQLREDYDRQRDLLTSLAERYPDDPLPMFFLASTESFNQGKDAEAVASAQRALEADPSFAAVYNVIGYAEMAQGNTAAAEEAFRTQIRLAPDEPNPYDSYGEFLLGQNKLNEAETQFEMALTKDPDFANSRMNLVRIAMERSDLLLEQAIANGDANAAGALYAENAVVMAPDMPRVRGRDAIRDLMAGMIASGVDGADIQTVSVIDFDDWAVRESNVVLSAGGEIVDQLKALELWQLVDGEWLYVRDMFNSDGPEAMSGTN